MGTVDARDWQNWPDKDRLHMTLPDHGWAVMGPIVATCFGASGMNGSVPAILCEMKNPKQMKRVLTTAVTTIVVLYLIVMGCGYYGYGQYIQDDIVDNMMRLPTNETQAFKSFSHWTGAHAELIGDVVSVLLIVKLVIAVPLNVMAVFYSFQTLKGTSHLVPEGSLANRCLRIVITCIIISIAVSVTNFSKLFPLVASIAGPMMQTVMPLILSYKVRRQVGAKMSGCGRTVAHIFIMLLSVFSITMGFYQSLLDVLRSS